MNDLISRSAMIAEYEWLKQNTGEYNHAELDEHIERIKKAPAVDAEPVLHGQWLPKKVGAVTTEFECSECGRIVTLTNSYFGKAPKYVSSYYPYCHCGAKLDAEVEHENA